MKSRSAKRAKYKAEKKKRLYHRLAQYSHNTLTLLINVGLILFAYILLYDLIYEPIFVYHNYGASDTREFLLLSFVGAITGISFIFRYLLHFDEEQQWQKNWKLLRDVNFDLERYSSLKRMGINRVSKKKKKYHKSVSSEETDS